MHREYNRCWLSSELLFLNCPSIRWFTAAFLSPIPHRASLFQCRSGSVNRSPAESEQNEHIDEHKMSHCEIRVGSFSTTIVQLSYCRHSWSYAGPMWLSIQLRLLLDRNFQVCKGETRMHYWSIFNRSEQTCRCVDVHRHISICIC